jgi:hypothetical protein
LIENPIFDRCAKAVGILTFTWLIFQKKAHLSPIK